MKDIREWIEGCGEVYLFDNIDGCGTHMYEMESRQFIFAGSGNTEEEALHNLFLDIRGGLLRRCDEIEEDKL